jgi:hypothetical protein
MHFKSIAMACLLLMFALNASADKDETHWGKIVTAFGTYEGMITVNLNGPNKETIPIETTVTDIKEKGYREKSSKTVALSPYLISSIIIDSVTYQFNRVKVKNGKYYDNCLITLKYGTPQLGIYQWGDQSASDKMLVYHEEWGSLLPLTDQTVYDFGTWRILFLHCEELTKELEEKRAFVTAAMSSDEKLKELKRLIDQSANCLRKKAT